MFDLNFIVFIHSYKDPKSRTSYQCKTAFQVQIKPANYTVGPETVGAKWSHTIIDENISNDELEWMTNTRGIIILYGILIKME